MVKEEKEKRAIQKYEPEKGVVKYQSPGMIVTETSSHYTARIKIKPELKNNLKFKVRKNSLEVSLSKKEEKRIEDREKGFFFFGSRQAGLSSEVYLEREVDTSSVKSEYKDSILTITMPKKK